MLNEEFQKLVLEELKSLREGQKSLETGQKELTDKVGALELG